MDFRSVIARTITRVKRPRNEHDPVLVVSTALGRRGLIVGIFHGSFLLYLISAVIDRPDQTDQVDLVIVSVAFSAISVFMDMIRSYILV